LRAMARAVLLAFADLGIYLSSDRERLIRKARALDIADPGEMAEFLDLCIDAELMSPDEAERLQLDPAQARTLAHSLDGHTPVPDEQADDWVRRLGPSTI
ncbi:MAG TPA: hypothetical protein VFO60_00450, partial [Candidatus Dormibacteraeota bacterium]|nr:hypothetical protein [Candidatus Dormibacteraeota bacterium]